MLVFTVLLITTHKLNAAVQTQSAQVDYLIKTQNAWDGSLYQFYPQGQPELSVLKFHIKPNSKLPWHIHPYPNAGYVLQGTLTIEDQLGHKHTYTQGQAFAESVKHVHRGVTGSDGATLVIVYSGVHGIKPSESEPGEKPEF